MTGERGVLTMGTGPDHSLIDVYIDGSLWQSYDCYSETASERDITLPQGTALEIRNRSARNLQSSGTVIRFKQLATYSLSFDETVIDYTYDALSRLLQADYNNGTTVYNYGYDVAGNLVNNNGTTRTYNAANQMTQDGTNMLTYDSNGNLTNDGTTTLSWDRANRMLSHGANSYAYDGDSNRVSQNTLQYLLDVQPELAVVLGDSDGNHYVHGVRGIHAQVDNSSTWEYMAQDGLGSVRSLIDDSALVIESRAFDEYGSLVSGSMAQSPIGFTGEFMHDDLVYLRARYYDTGLGVFNTLDPFEGVHSRPMSLNGYSWVEGNTPNAVDPSGKCTIQLFACAASLINVADNAIGIGFGIDAVACGWAISCAGAQAVLDLIRQHLGVEGVQFLAPLLGINTATEVVATNVDSQFQSDTKPFNYINPDLVSCQPEMAVTMMSVTTTYPMTSTFSYSHDESQAQGSSVPIPQPDDNRMCTPGGTLKPCEKIPSDSSFYSYEEAFQSVENQYQLECGDLSKSLHEREHERQRTDNYCVDMGSHSQIYDPTDVYIGSITCCPCCDGWTYGVRCFYNPAKG